MMNKKMIKPNLDLITARFSIFVILAILFTILSVNGLPSWFLWVVLLLGVFSIFSAAIKADEDMLTIYDSEKAIISYIKKLNSEREEYKFVAESLDDLYVREVKKSKELQEQVKELKTRIDSAQFTLEEIRERFLDNPEAQDLCDLAYVILDGKKTTECSQYHEFKFGDEITAKFNNFMNQELIVTGIVREVKKGVLCCNDKITGRSFAINFDELHDQGDRFEAHRDKAEETILKGARLTKHKVDL